MFVVVSTKNNQNNIKYGFTSTLHKGTIFNVEITYSHKEKDNEYYIAADFKELVHQGNIVTKEQSLKICENFTEKMLETFVSTITK